MSGADRPSSMPETTAWEPPGVNLEGEALQSVILCKGCGATVPWDAAFCPGCAAPQRGHRPVDTSPIADEQPRPPHTPAAHAEELPELEDAAATPPGRETWRSRALIAASCAVAVLVVAAVAWWLLVLRPANAALATAASAIGAVEGVFADATDVEALDAGVLQSALRELESAFALTEGRRGTGVWNRAGDVLGAERVVAVALIELTPEEGRDLPSWSGSIGGAADAVGALADVYSEQGLSNRASTDVLSAGIAAVAADVAVTETAGGLAALVSDLSQAEKIADVADVGTAAGERVTEVAVIRGVIDDESVLDHLGAITAVMSALEGLDGLEAERLERWETLHTDLRATVRELNRIDGSSAEPIATVVTTALRSTDQLINAAATAMSAWEEEVADVRQSVRDDLGALDAYSTAVEAQLSRYSDLRNTTQAFSDRIKSGALVTYDEGYAFFFEASEQRSAVREAISATTSPAGVATAHNGLLGVIDRAILAIDAAIEGTWQDQSCWYDCYYADTPGWKRFVSESEGITEAFGTAESTWRGALQTARDAIENRETPPMPSV